MSYARQRLGRRGEAETAQRLKSLGWEIVAHGWRCCGGEIDLIGLDAGTVVFVEVKTRASEVHGLPERSVGLRKRLKIIRAAGKFLRSRGWTDRSIRFDVAAVTPDGVRLIQGAFGAGGWTPRSA